MCCLMRARLRLMEVLKMKCLAGFWIDCCCDLSGGMQISAKSKSCKYLLKTLKEVRLRLELEVFGWKSRPDADRYLNIGLMSTEIQNSSSRTINNEIYKGNVFLSC